jgi:hypothetical protein
MLIITPTNYTLVYRVGPYCAKKLSGIIIDSARVVGRWNKNNSGDSISFSSKTELDSCFRWALGWYYCNGHAPYYCNCPDSFSMKIDIRDSIWYARILNFEDSHDTLTYNLKKQ